MPQKTKSEYWKMVNDGARDKAIKKTSFGTRFWAALVAWAVGVSGAGIFGGNLSQSLYVGGATLGIWILVYLAAFRIFLKNEPVILYNKQAETIDRYYPEDLEISVYDANFREVVDAKGNKIPVVALEVHNLNQKLKMVELEAEINHLNHTCIDSTGPMTLPHFAGEKAVWDDDTTNTSIRPGDKKILFLAFISPRPHNTEPSTILGPSYSHYLFERESMYQVKIVFRAKMEGSDEFRRGHVDRVIYSDPSKGKIYDGNYLRVISEHEAIPKELMKILEVADEGYWYDYSSPFRRQQAQIQKDARDAAAKKKK